MAEPGYTRDQQGSTKVVIYPFEKSVTLNFWKCGSKVVIFHFAKFVTLNFWKCGSNLGNFELLTLNIPQAALEASWSGLVEKLGENIAATIFLR